MKNELLKALNWRYACKAFDPSQKVSPEKLEALLESLRLTPSSFGMQPWHFLVVEDPEIKAKLRPKSWDQAQITDCSHLIVHCAMKSVSEADVDHYMQNVMNVTGAQAEHLKDYKDMIWNTLQSRSPEAVLTWAQKQVYISQGFLLEAAALLEVDACPMEGFDPKAYDEILGLTDTNYTATVLTALGHRSTDDKYASKPKVRFPLEEVVERV